MNAPEVSLHAVMARWEEYKHAHRVQLVAAVTAGIVLLLVASPVALKEALSEDGRSRSMYIAPGGTTDEADMPADPKTTRKHSHTTRPNLSLRHVSGSSTVTHRIKPVQTPPWLDCVCYLALP